MVLSGPVHHPFEHGKDIVAISSGDELCAFQLKGGDLSLEGFEAIQGQLFALAATSISYPGIEPPRPPDEAFLVLNGFLTPPARDRLEALNSTLRLKGLPTITCVERSALLTRFISAHGRFLPGEPSYFKEFLSLLLANGKIPFPSIRLMRFLETLLEEGRPNTPMQLSRAIASSTLLVNYIVEPWRGTDNHIGVAEAWLSMSITIVRLAAEYNLPERLWEGHYLLAMEEVRAALVGLLEEAEAADDLVQPDLTESFFYPTRALIVCGYLAALFLSERLRVGGIEYGDRVKAVLMRELQYVRMIGEVGVPFVFSVSNALAELGEKKSAVELMYALANSIAISNSPTSESALLDPYHSLEEILSSLVENEVVEEFCAGQSYMLHATIEWLVRRGLRDLVEVLWPRVTYLTLLEFEISKPSRILSTEDKDGTLKTWLPQLTQSWASLQAEAAIIGEGQLPAELWRKAELIPYLGLVLPYRFNSVLAKAVDYLIERLCQVEFLPEAD